MADERTPSSHPVATYEEIAARDGDDDIRTDGGQAADDPDGSAFDVELPDGSVLGTDATLEHTHYGALTVSTRRRTPSHTKILFRIEGAEDRLFVEFTGEEIREQWGETIHDDPAVLYGDGDGEDGDAA